MHRLDLVQMHRLDRWKLPDFDSKQVFTFNHQIGLIICPKRISSMSELSIYVTGKENCLWWKSTVVTVSGFVVEAIYSIETHVYSNSLQLIDLCCYGLIRYLKSGNYQLWMEHTQNMKIKSQIGSFVQFCSVLHWICMIFIFLSSSLPPSLSSPPPLSLFHQPSWMIPIITWLPSYADYSTFESMLHR